MSEFERHIYSASDRDLSRLVLAVSGPDDDEEEMPAGKVFSAYKLINLGDGDIQVSMEIAFKDLEAMKKFDMTLDKLDDEMDSSEPPKCEFGIMIFNANELRIDN